MNDAQQTTTIRFNRPDAELRAAELIHRLPLLGPEALSALMLAVTTEAARRVHQAATVEAQPVATGHPQVVKRTRFEFLGPLGETLAKLTPQQAQVVMILLEAPYPYQGTKALYAALASEFPDPWEHKTSGLAQVYAGAEQALRHTRYPLIRERGVYGFVTAPKGTGDGTYGPCVVARD